MRVTPVSRANSSAAAGNHGALALMPDGRYALSGGGDHTLRLWHVDTGK